VSLVNASNWPKIASCQEPTYGVGVYPTTVPANWCDHHRPFAYVTRNEKSGTIRAWRDHFGQEPFYYSYQNRQFIFGSTIPAIIQHLPKHPSPNIPRILIELLPWQGTNWTQYSNETYYEGIFRVEPGHALTVANDRIVSKPFWQIDPEASRILYKNDNGYIEHFAELLQEAIETCTRDVTSIAAEFSGGLDSSTIVVACNQAGINPALYSHVAPAGSDEKDDLAFAQCLIDHLGLAPLRAVTEDGFDLESVLNQLAHVFAGAAPYVFFMLANNVHQAVVRGGHTLLLSGFGGDECVSGHALQQAFFPQLLRHGLHRQAWNEMRCQAKTILGTTLRLLRYVHPALNKLAAKPPRQMFPYYPSLQHLEWDLLQGPRSHHVRMRVEYSAIVAKTLGFSYAYPLLYPKLVDFYCRLPWEQKRRNGVGRYLLRQYLAKHGVPNMVWEKGKKGGGIIPATLHVCKKMHREGQLANLFRDLPFAEHVAKINEEQAQLFAQMDAYMFKHYWALAGVID